MAIEQDSSDPTGVSGDGNGHHLVRARERKSNAALQLKIAGADWEQIAEVIGYPTARMALVAVESALERELKSEYSKPHMRQLATKRLERLLRSTWTKAVDPNHPEHLAAVTKARELVGQWTKLNGLDAPSEMIMHSPAESEIDQWVATITKGRRPELEEADIFEAEIVDPAAIESAG